MKFDGLLKTSLKKSKTKDQTEKRCINIGAAIDSGVKLKKLEVCWLIEGQNIQIQNHGAKWKRQPTSGLAFEFGKDAIELILKMKISIDDWIEQINN